MRSALLPLIRDRHGEWQSRVRHLHLPEHDDGAQCRAVEDLQVSVSILQQATQQAHVQVD